MSDQRDTTVPRFFLDKNLNNIASEKAGHPVYDSVEKVEIIIPGQSLSTAVRFVNQELKNRWPQQYAAFKAGMEAPVEGTPIEEWPPLIPAEVANLKAINIMTVEQLSQINDNAISTMGHGARALRDKAAAWLKNAAGGQALSEATARASRAEAKLETLQRNYGDLAARVDALQRAAAQGADAG